MTCGTIKKSHRKRKKFLTKPDLSAIIKSQSRKGENKMTYEIYPCDLDPMGECPKRCQDCTNCKGWNFPPDADEEE